MSSSLDEYGGRLETGVLEKLRLRFEALGYDFLSQPTSNDLPTFFEGWRPDAIAVSGNDKIAIEVKSAARRQDDSILQLSKRFKGREPWRLAVVVGENGIDDQNSTLIVLENLREGQKTMRRLAHEGYGLASLVVAFSLLEGALRITETTGSHKPMRPASVIETLAMEGFIDPPDAERLRSMIAVRNRYVHGGLEVQVSSEELQAVLSAVDKVIATLILP